MKTIFAIVALAVAGAAQGQYARPKSDAPQGERGPDVPAFWIRPGFKVTLAAKGIADARFMEFDNKGTLYLSRPGKGDVLTLTDNGSGMYDKKATFVDGLKTVHGLCFNDGWLWFTQSTAVYKGKDADGDGKIDEKITVIPPEELPPGGGHWWRSILVTDKFLYTSIGDPGNITDLEASKNAEEPRFTEREKIFRFNLDGTGKQLFASGIRNTEKLRLRPGTDEVWGSDHGSDWYGKEFGDKEGAQPITDYNPPDELNYYREGSFYGHPFVVGFRTPRLEFKSRPDIVDLASRTVVPEWGFGAHYAINGFTFIHGNKQFAPDVTGDLFAASHGSWNRKEKAGYRIEQVLFDDVTGKPYGSLIVVSTLGPKGEVLARPVDCVEAPDGSILWSDDNEGAIYRISRAEKE
ncbi:sorbosone dehydrogenase family protein [soil metagenome]